MDSKRPHWAQIKDVGEKGWELVNVTVSPLLISGGLREKEIVIAEGLARTTI